MLMQTGDFSIIVKKKKIGETVSHLWILLTAPN